ncbi:hypothetical protein AVEN_200187-1 [Araneus ventricosus]|uniref:Uncharacterized protein n=1 Tax=Araneus ventricosus TaxID=182803 RepID=A0A4Y2MDC7_ARAVE|nr:hypothetical protein AVEN_200187-1 [Araneus ventricosus]
MAHAGYLGNELADHYAKIATTSGDEMDIPDPYSYVKFTIEEHIIEEWGKYWPNDDSEAGRRIRRKLGDADHYAFDCIRTERYHLQKNHQIILKESGLNLCSLNETRVNSVRRTVLPTMPRKHVFG